MHTINSFIANHLFGMEVSQLPQGLGFDTPCDFLNNQGHVAALVHNMDANILGVEVLSGTEGFITIINRGELTFSHTDYCKSVMGAIVMYLGVNPQDFGIYGELLPNMNRAA